MSLLRRFRSRTERGVVAGAVFFALTTADLAYAQTYTLGGRVDYSAGTGVQGMQITDLNQDGTKDIVTVNYGADSLSVLMGIPGGGYLPRVDYPVGDRPFTVMVTDLNNDIQADLLVANYGTNNVSVLLGNGTGAFASRTDYATGTGPFIARSADFNEDGNVDVVCVNNTTDNVSILLGNGTGGLAAPVHYATADSPSWVVIGDFDRDGHKDLLVTNVFSNSFSILRGNGNGTFQPKVDTSLGAGSHPQSCTLAYLDGDDILDLAVAVAQPTNRLAVRMGNGTGGFGPQTNYPAGAPVTVVAGDFNVDGKVDLATADQGGSNVSIHLNSGTGTFPTRTTTAVGGGPFSMAITDLTGDGEPDLVTGNYFANNVTVLSGSVPGGWRLNDQIPNLTAFDQTGTSRSLASYLGKWVLLDMCTSWCPPCNYMAEEAQQVYQTWVGHPTVQFEYLTCLVDGPTAGSPSSQADAQAWSDLHDVQRPILHASGLPQSQVRPYNDAVGTNAFPSLLIIDPTGKIRYRAAGGMDGQSIVDQVAALAGVAAPTLYVPPPPPPPPPAPISMRAMTAATVEVKYGASTWSGPLSVYEISDDHRQTRLVADANNPVFGVPGIPSGAWIEIGSRVEDDLIERTYFFVATFDEHAVIETALPWQVKVTSITWPDGAPRVLDEETSPLVGVTFLDLGGDYWGFLETPIELYLQWNGAQLQGSSMAIGNFPELPPTTNGFSAAGIAFSHAGAVDVGPRAVPTRLELATPVPSPAFMTTAIRWSMPQAGDATLEIYDVSGRRVAQLHSGKAEAGEHTASWDLADDDGKRVSAGVYFVRFVSGAEERSTRLVVVNR